MEKPLGSAPGKYILHQPTVMVFELVEILYV